MTFTPAEIDAWCAGLPAPASPSTAPRPLHTVYGGAHLFGASTLEKLGALALAHLQRHGRDASTFAAALGVPPALAEEVWARTGAMLRAAPIQDYRIDFEDGFGPRSDDEEDAAAVAAAEALAARASGGGPLPALGIRIRALEGDTAPRALRTLDRFLSTAARAGGWGGGPFVVTLPKVGSPRSVAVLAAALDRLEAAIGLPSGAVGVELMVERPAALIAPDGRVAVPGLVAAAAGRCVAVHLGAYDLTAACGVPAGDQALDHPLCDAARTWLQLALGETPVRVVDGATTLLPVGPHRGASPSERERAENDRAVHAAWAAHARNVRRAWAQGIPQGWDLHPGQIPARFGTCVALALGSLPATSERLRSFLDNAARATRTGSRFDDAATGLGLLRELRTGLQTGLLTPAEVRSAGVEPDALALPFAALVARRGGGGGATG